MLFGVEDRVSSRTGHRSLGELHVAAKHICFFDSYAAQPQEHATRIGTKLLCDIVVGVRDKSEPCYVFVHHVIVGIIVAMHSDIENHVQGDLDVTGSDRCRFRAYWPRTRCRHAGKRGDQLLRYALDARWMAKESIPMHDAGDVEQYSAARRSVAISLLLS